MKKLALAAFLAMTTPALAALDEGFWVSEDVGASFEFVGMEFYIHPFDEDYTSYKCAIVSWPVSSPIAKGECENGDKYDLEISVDGLKVNGFEMIRTFEAPD